MKQNTNSPSVRRFSSKSLSAPLAFYVLFLIALTFVASEYKVTAPPVTVLSFALLCAPYWFLGFGLDQYLSRALDSPLKRLTGAAALILPWLVFAIPQGQFTVSMFAGLLAAILAIAGLLELARKTPAPHWLDWATLALLAGAVEWPYFRGAWNAPGLAALSKLLFVDAGLFGYLVIRPIGGVGFELRPRAADFTLGLREFCFYTPIALSLGFLLGFLHLHNAGFPALQFLSAWIFTLFFVALPEEIFFRGLVLNLLERRWGTRTALWSSALIFGLAHFPKRAAFNWRYVILAAIAGIFYGRAWLARRRVLTSGVTHATVDGVWSVWFR